MTIRNDNHFRMQGVKNFSWEFFVLRWENLLLGVLNFVPILNLQPRRLI